MFEQMRRTQRQDSGPSGGDDIFAPVDNPATASVSSGADGNQFPVVGMTVGQIRRRLRDRLDIDPESMRSGHWAAIAYAMAGDTESAEDVAQRFLQANSLNFTYLGLLKFLGRQEELDALAAEIDQRPAGHVILAGAFLDCICGPLFDLDLTPNFKARLREGELDWPPVMTIDPSLAR